MAVREILQLGDERLHAVALPVDRDDPALYACINDLHNTLDNFKDSNGWGQAIAAPQIGIHKRIIYVNIDGPWVVINPVLESFSEEFSEGYDACLSFPHLLVKVRCSVNCVLTYTDLDWKENRVELNGALSYLMQHECDHLDGILATQRALNSEAIITRSDYEKLKKEN